MVFSVVERPEPLRPEQTDDFAGANAHRDAMQDMALVVVGVQVFDLEQAVHACTSSPR